MESLSLLIDFCPPSPALPPRTNRSSGLSIIHRIAKLRVGTNIRLGASCSRTFPRRANSPRTTIPEPHSSLLHLTADLTRVAAVGESAGGFLTLQLEFLLVGITWGMLSHKFATWTACSGQSVMRLSSSPSALSALVCIPGSVGDRTQLGDGKWRWSDVRRMDGHERTGLGSTSKGPLRRLANGGELQPRRLILDGF